MFDVAVSYCSCLALFVEERDRTRDVVDLRRVLAIVRSNLVSLIAWPVLFAPLGTLLFRSASPRYQSSAVVEINGSYFQNPLLDDLVMQVGDPEEIKAQRTSLLRLAFNRQFLDYLTESHHQYWSTPDSAARAQERESFAGRAEFYALGPTTFRVSMTGVDPAVTKEIPKTRNVLVFYPVRAKFRRRLAGARTRLEKSHAQTLRSAPHYRK